MDGCRVAIVLISFASLLLALRVLRAVHRRFRWHEMLRLLTVCGPSPEELLNLIVGQLNERKPVF